jgi:hypothetical protein
MGLKPEPDDKLEIAGSDPFTVLFYPSDDQKSYIQTRLTEGPLRNHMQYEKLTSVSSRA